MRVAAIIQARGASSAASAANALVDTVRNLTTATPAGEIFSVCVPSDGNPYGIPEGIVYSFPVRSDGTNWEIVGGFEQGDFGRAKMETTTAELLEERDELLVVRSERAQAPERPDRVAADERVRRCERELAQIGSIRLTGRSRRVHDAAYIRRCARDARNRGDRNRAGPLLRRT